MYHELRKRGTRSAACRCCPVVTALVLVWLPAAQAAGPDCVAEAAKLAAQEAELPVIDLTPPIHHELVCITVETLLDFARRVTAHIRRCPASAYAEKAAAFDEAVKNYTAQFRELKCRPAL